MSMDEIQAALDELRENVEQLRLELAEQRRELGRDIERQERRLGELANDVIDIERRLS